MDDKPHKIRNLDELNFIGAVFSQTVPGGLGPKNLSQYELFSEAKIRRKASTIPSIF
jgi:hypothetical protein